MKIIPGKSIGSFSLGQTEDQVRAIQPNGWEVEQRKGCYLLKSPDLELFFSEDEKCVDQIMATGSNPSKMEKEIGIGSKLEDLEQAYGEADLDDEGNIIVEGLDGICFDITDHNDELEPSALITDICVYPL